jgi:hypothetical protein
MHTSIIYRKEEEEMVALWELGRVSNCVSESIRKNEQSPHSSFGWGGYFADLNSSSYVFKKRGTDR